MAFSEQHVKDLILSSIDFLKSGSNKDHNYLTKCLNKLLPALEAMKEDGFSFQHIIKADDNVVSNWKFDMDDVEELERFIDNYTMNEICFGYPADFDLPADFDRHMLTEDLLIVQSV
tara:strand:+ start:152 stop:502 length:351 start_codon:yes stop_codon:yes gene_type:complete